MVSMFLPSPEAHGSQTRNSVEPNCNSYKEPEVHPECGLIVLQIHGTSSVTLKPTRTLGPSGAKAQIAFSGPGYGPLLFGVVPSASSSQWGLYVASLTGV